ncbi:Oxoglutarate/iron-dependent dioxygenase [Corchorus olitorius]|uniref:2-oxoglutarate-dependent dioxygenase DAO n=1 Tax=Corchorus olitorius TaxID=93759 RepID=A0A1R3IDI2_9ROSI|nr:Oxoglutarate/iron-dependent dioxygenase [Corchorus olitorius]
MGYDSQLRIPIIELPLMNSEDMVRGTDKWQSLCKRVREACENFGCFEVVYDKISSHLKEETFSSIRQFFDLPLETKKKYVNPKPYHGYYEVLGLLSSLSESIGLEHASNFNSLKSFSQLMWPNGHDHFCQSISTMMKQLEELSEMIGLMIVDSYGLGEEAAESFLKHYMLLRLMKYLAPPSGEYTNALIPHTDKCSSALLCEDQIAGLEIETKDGQWVKVFPSPGSFVFMVGDILMAWSNRRMHAVKHRVMMKGKKDRYSFAAFAIPVEGSIIKAPKELVDEDHPQVFRDFDYTDFFNFSYSEEMRYFDSSKKLFVYAAQPIN